MWQGFLPYSIQARVANVNRIWRILAHSPTCRLGTEITNLRRYPYMHKMSEALTTNELAQAHNTILKIPVLGGAQKGLDVKARHHYCYIVKKRHSKVKS